MNVNNVNLNVHVVAAADGDCHPMVVAWWFVGSVVLFGLFEGGGEGKRGERERRVEIL